MLYLTPIQNIKKHKYNYILLLAYSIISFCMLSSCAQITENTNYSTQVSSPPTNLIMPPTLSNINLNKEYQLITKPNNKYILNKIKNITIKDAGSQRWLVINNKSVDEMWPIMIEFLQQQGLNLQYQNQQLGIMQTNWAIKNHDTHKTDVRAFFDWVGWGNMYSLTSQYMFRINIWQNDNNTNIFVTDVQMTEVYPNCNKSLNSSIELSDRQITKWMQLPPNPQLELEFLVQFMVFVSDEQINPIKTVQAIEQQKANNANSIQKQLINNNHELIINDDFDRTWWRTALALERVGLGIADKNRNLGEYYVYSLQNNINIPEQGFFSKLFGSGAGNTLQMPEAQYIIKLTVVTASQATINQSSKNVNNQISNSQIKITMNNIQIIKADTHIDDNSASAIKKYLSALAKELN